MKLIKLYLNNPFIDGLFLSKNKTVRIKNYLLEPS